MNGYGWRVSVSGTDFLDGRAAASSAVGNMGLYSAVIGGLDIGDRCIIQQKKAWFG